MIQQTAPANPTGEYAPAASAPRQLGNHCTALYQRLQAMRNGSAHLAQAVGVTSCGRGEGVSTVAANLAISAARLGSGTVLLVDAHSDHPSVARSFGLDIEPGLFDALSGTISHSHGIRPSPIDRLSILPAGSQASRGKAVVDLPRWAELIEQLKQPHDMVVVDLPPAEQLGSCYVLTGALDGVLLVVEAERVRNELARRVKQQLEQAGAHVLGVVLNKGR